jgi:hypothetical protein
MSVPRILEKLVGEWSGKNLLHLSWMPEQTPFESDSEASVALTANGRFLKIEYDWNHDGKPQEGLILLGNEKETNSVKAFWIDSWHLSDKFMVSEGFQDENGAISVKGFYTVPDHPDWGWRTIIEPADDSSFKMTMYNVTPDGAEDLAVEAFYKRQ